ncbi:hypothetical protein [Methylosinus sp. Sm6]|uniref:hypothetical protein n=1 Tax=Methylosinus sp. Sm6 TaxID=2866948 RepID=UPI001C99D6A0|nr:hypothetical protein [Methylosinus sp. Sm6]MBY6242495.1 hypothetical protein [Methylosinus sp. Sm6]
MLVAMSGFAQAAIVQVTYSGNVSSGVDTTGVFGAPGVNLAGLPFTVYYVFDTARGAVTMGPPQFSAVGGAANGTTSPSITTLVVINNRGLLYSGAKFGQILGYNDGQVSQQAHESDLTLNLGGRTFNVNLAESITDFGVALPATITGPLNYVVGPNDSAAGQLSFTITNTATGQSVGSAEAILDTSSLRVRTLFGAASVSSALQPSSALSHVTRLGVR